jgi:hypothetical protein
MLDELVLKNVKAATVGLGLVKEGLCRAIYHFWDWILG